MQPDRFEGDSGFHRIQVYVGTVLLHSDSLQADIWCVDTRLANLRPLESSIAINAPKEI